MAVKQYRDVDVLTAARNRIAYTFDHCERVYTAFSGGKDSSVLFHLVMEEAIRRGREVAVMFIDFEAQYAETIRHVEEMFALYGPYIDKHWICIPMLLRNAVTNFEPRWVTWDEDKRDLWIRDKPDGCKTERDYPFALPNMEFEEFIILFGQWYGQGKKTAGFIGIRAQESLHRYCAIATWAKRGLTLNGQRWTTNIADDVYNVYPIYDWLSEDIWRYHARYPDKPHNGIYDKMQMAGVPLSHQRLCQPFGDDQRRGLWLYHILEPETWFKLIARVNGANSGALYIEESGNINGYNKITKPPNHTWRSFCNLLLRTMPKKTRDHYTIRFKKFIFGWSNRGYKEIPEEAPPELEAKCWAPSWRRMCKVLLRNDYWCKGLGQAQPKSEAYQRYKAMKQAAKSMGTMELDGRLVRQMLVALGVPSAMGYTDGKLLVVLPEIDEIADTVSSKKLDKSQTALLSSIRAANQCRQPFTLGAALPQEKISRKMVNSVCISEIVAHNTSEGGASGPATTDTNSRSTTMATATAVKALKVKKADMVALAEAVGIKDAADKVATGPIDSKKLAGLLKKGAKAKLEGTLSSLYQKLAAAAKEVQPVEVVEGAARNGTVERTRSNNVGTPRAKVLGRYAAGPFTRWLGLQGVKKEAALKLLATEGCGHLSDASVGWELKERRPNRAAAEVTPEDAKEIKKKYPEVFQK